jgi:putative heme iron utilization protein
MSEKRTASEFLRAHRYGVLATQSQSLPGYPFGSITPYVLSAAGEPVIYISTLAEHTKNIAADPRVSLTVFDPADADDPQAGPRLTFLAEAHALTGDAATAERYYRYFPAARAYAGTHDFGFYALRAVRLRFIGGFGKIGWIEPADVDLANPLAPVETGIVDHMNSDHADAVRAYCGHFFGRDTNDAVLVGADPDGIDLLADGVPLRLPFEARADTADAVRQRLIALLAVARQPSAASRGETT